MADNEVQVQPNKKGGWFINKVVEGKATKGKSFDQRRDAIDAAREVAAGACRVVLMREDGTEFGELDAPPSAGGETTAVDLEPAREEGAAG